MNFEILAPPAGLERDFVITMVATWFGTGLVAPLRAGLAVFATLPLAYLCLRTGRTPVIAFALAVLALGFWASEIWELSSGIKDDRLIVIDEVAAVLFGLAVAGLRHWLALAGFATVFLFLDRLKPWPFDTL